jgi:DNA-binding LacI/PurR family transcriptional regulator
VVLIGERAVPARFDHVLMDNVGGARAATALLLRTGARRIALLGGKASRQQTMPALRTRGYRKAHEEASVPLRPELIIDPVHDTLGAYDAVRTLINDKIDFDAVFALTDTTAYGALRALVEAGRHVPDDVQVVGFDNLRASRFTVPSLTSVEPDNDAMADAICSLLVERIAQGSTPVPARVIMPEAKIVERESTRRG